MKIKRTIGLMTLLVGILLLSSSWGYGQTKNIDQIFNSIYDPTSVSLSMSAGDNPNTLGCSSSPGFLNAEQILNCVYDATGHKLYVNGVGGGTGSPGGSPTQFQFNDSGSFNGTTQFTWDKTNLVAALSAGTLSGLVQTTGSGLWDPTVGGVNLVGHDVVYVKICTPPSGTSPTAVGPVNSTSLGVGGSGYAPGDTGHFDQYNDGSDPVYVVDTVDGGGAVLTYHLTSNGEDYSGYVIGFGFSTVATSGAGTGLTIVVNSITPNDAFMSAQGEAPDCSVPVEMWAQSAHAAFFVYTWPAVITDQLTLSWATTTGHTIGDTGTITLTAASVIPSFSTPNLFAANANIGTLTVKSIPGPLTWSGLWDGAGSGGTPASQLWINDVGQCFPSLALCFTGQTENAVAPQWLTQDFVVLTADYTTVGDDAPYNSYTELNSQNSEHHTWTGNWNSFNFNSSLDASTGRTHVTQDYTLFNTYVRSQTDSVVDGDVNIFRADMQFFAPPGGHRNFLKINTPGTDYVVNCDTSQSTCAENVGPVKSTGQLTVATSSDPGCTTSADIGRWWMDNTTTTTAIKICKAVSGTVGWSAVTVAP